jgi:hypothetical protein
MARLAAKARCNYYPLPDREAELIRSCLTFPDQAFSALDPCAGEGRAMAVITDSSKAIRHGIELDAYRAEAAARVLEHVIQGRRLGCARARRIVRISLLQSAFILAMFSVCLICTSLVFRQTTICETELMIDFKIYARRFSG